MPHAQTRMRARTHAHAHACKHSDAQTNAHASAPCTCFSSASVKSCVSCPATQAITETLTRPQPTSAPRLAHICALNRPTPFCTGTGRVPVQMWATSATGDHVITANVAGDKHRTARVMLRVRPRLPIACTIESEYMCSADDGRVLAGKGSVRCRQHSAVAWTRPRRSATTDSDSIRRDICAGRASRCSLATSCGRSGVGFGCGSSQMRCRSSRYAPAALFRVSQRLPLRLRQPGHRPL